MSDQSNDHSEFPVNVEDTPSNALTCIPRPIHCPATRISGWRDIDELDRIAIDNFIDAIAEVALVIATRETAPSEDQERGD